MEWEDEGSDEWWWWWQQQRRRENLECALAGSVLAAAALCLYRVRLSLRRRVYVTRGDLLQPRQECTPWGRLWAEGSDMAFISYLSLDRDSFDALHRVYCDVERDLAARRHSEEPGAANRGGRPPALSSQGRLAVALYYLVSPCQQKDMCLIFGLPPSTLNRTLWSALENLLVALQRSPEARISWPTTAELTHFNFLISLRSPMAAAAGAWGTIDGLNLDVEEPFGDPVLQNAMYNGWYCRVKVSCVLVFSADGTIAYVKGNAPGEQRERESLGMRENFGDR